MGKQQAAASARVVFGPQSMRVEVQASMPVPVGVLISSAYTAFEGAIKSRSKTDKPLPEAIEEIRKGLNINSVTTDETVEVTDKDPGRLKEQPTFKIEPVNFDALTEVLGHFFPESKELHAEGVQLMRQNPGGGFLTFITKMLEDYDKGGVLQGITAGICLALASNDATFMGAIRGCQVDHSDSDYQPDTAGKENLH